MKRGDLIEVPWFEYKLKHNYSCRFRIDPVPFTGYYYRFGRYYRYPRTTQEKREYTNAEEFEVHVRGRRRPRMLPNAWDEFPIGRYSKRSWKRRKKRKQWM